MRSKKYLFLVILLIVSSFFFIWSSQAASLAEKVKGKILLQVEENGEAWYVYPNNLQRYYLGRPADAFEIMRSLGLGISNKDLRKIPVAEKNFGGQDSDSDGLSDVIEDAFGTNKFLADSDEDGHNDKTEILAGYEPSMKYSGNYIDATFANQQKGKILLQVEAHGEAWYVNPVDGKRYYLGRPADAFEIMRSLGLGITNDNLEQIEISIESEYPTDNTTAELPVQTSPVVNQQKQSEEQIETAETNVVELINSPTAQPIKSMYPYIATGDWQTLFAGKAITADNNITVDLVDIYNIENDYCADKGISLNYYIDNKRINRYTNYYALKDSTYTCDKQPNQLILYDFGLKLTIMRNTATYSSIDIKVENYEDANFSACQQLYDICLGKSSHVLQPRDCLKYCNYIDDVANHKIAQDENYIVIAPNDYSNETVNNFLNYTKNIYNKVQAILGYSPTLNSYIAVQIEPYNVGISSNSHDQGIYINAEDQATLYSANNYLDFTTDLAHEMVHFFNQVNNFGGFLEEGYTVYQDYLVKINNGYDYTLDCLENQVCSDGDGAGLASSYGCTDYNIDYYSVRACFFKELHEKYPTAYQQIVDEMISSRNVYDNQIYCLDDLEQKIGSSFFKTLQNKYLNQYEDKSAINSTQGDYCRKAPSGSSFGNYWD